MKRPLVNLLKTIIAVAIYAAIFWYSFSIAENPEPLPIAMVGLVSLGIAYGVWTALFKVAGEFAGGIMVLAEFLNRHLLEPQKQRLLEQGRKQGLKQAHDAAQAEAETRLDEARARLEEMGFDPDEILPRQSPGKTGGEE